MNRQLFARAKIKWNSTDETKPHKSASFCHSERSEESLFDLSPEQKQREVLRFAQNDNVLSFSAA